MAHLIDKDALVAEIERRMKNLTHEMSKFYYASNYNEWKFAVNEYKSLMSFIDTLEEKEVEIKKVVEQLKTQAEKRYDEIGKSGYIQPNQPLAKETDNIITIEYANNHNKEHAANLGYYNGVIRTCEKILSILKEPTKRVKYDR